MFGASVSALYLLIKSLINIGRAVDLMCDHKKCDHQKKKKKYTAYTGTVSQAWL